MRISDWSSDVCSSDLAVRSSNAPHEMHAGDRAAAAAPRTPDRAPSAAASIAAAAPAPPMCCRSKSRCHAPPVAACRSEEHTSELQSLMRISYAVFCLKKKKETKTSYTTVTHNKSNE